MFSVSCIDRLVAACIDRLVAGCVKLTATGEGIPALPVHVACPSGCGVALLLLLLLLG